MEKLPNDQPFLIYLSHENKKFEKELKEIILSEIDNVNVSILQSRTDITIINKMVSEADLIIIDLLKDQDHLEENIITKEAESKNITPYLLFTHSEKFDEKRISKIIKKYSKSIVDFIDEDHFQKVIFLNRIKVLLNIPKISKTLIHRTGELQENLWMALDYSNIFVVIIDKDFKVALSNYQLSKTLGFKFENELIGKDWADFLTASDVELVKFVNQESLNGNKKYEEFTHDILPLNKKPITVKWFNTLINNNFNCIFSIGVPITKEPNINDDVDSMRAYFIDIIKRDKTTINAMKEVTTKYSQQILGKNEERCNR